MKSFAIAMLLSGAASAYQVLGEADYEFMQFIAEYGKSYGTREEFEFRAATFKENYRQIQEFNAGNHTSKVGVNFMADLTLAERSIGEGTATEPSAPVQLSGKIPKRVDWEVEGKVSMKVGSLHCHAARAFATVGAVESLQAISSGNLTQYSVQQVIDCDSNSDGCTGGTVENASSYITSSGLIDDAAYPYTDEQGCCREDISDTKFTISGWNSVKADVHQVELATATQPQVATVDADCFAFQYYTQGVITAADCNTSGSHAVLVVGYNNEEQEGCKKVGLVRNSWGRSWGVLGDAKICLDDNACGILDNVSHPVL